MAFAPETVTCRCKACGATKEKVAVAEFHRLWWMLLVMVCTGIVNAPMMVMTRDESGWRESLPGFAAFALTFVVIYHTPHVIAYVRLRREACPQCEGRG